MRGRDLRGVRQQALAHLNEYNLSTTLAVTLQKSLNDDETGVIIDFALQQRCVHGVMFQPTQIAAGSIILTPELTRFRSPKCAGVCPLAKARFSLLPTCCPYPHHRRDGDGLHPKNRRRSHPPSPVTPTCSLTAATSSSVSATRAYVSTCTSCSAWTTPWVR